MIRVETLGPGAGQFAGLAQITIDRPEKRNALTAEMLDDLRARALELDADPAARAIVLRGEGEVFCSGFDLSVCREDSAALGAMLRSLSLAVRALRRLSKPVVAAARGAAVAGGCALLSGADLVVTSQSATLGYPVVRLGISPAINAHALRCAVGDRMTRSLLLDPALVTGTEARRIGLAHLCVDTPDDVLPRAQIEAMKLAAKPPAAYAATKRWLNEIEGSDRDDPFERGLAASLTLVGSDEERTRLAQLWKERTGTTRHDRTRPA